MRLLAIFGFLGFGLSLLVHLITFWGIDPSQRVPWIWLLHVGIFFVFGPMVFSARSQFKSERKGWVTDLRQPFDFWPKVLAPVPLWLRVVSIGFFVYAFVNFIVFINLSGGGAPSQRDGKYLLLNHGTVIRELTEEEYAWQQAYIVRGFSGHWMMFYLTSALYFAYHRKSEQ